MTCRQCKCSSSEFLKKQVCPLTGLLCSHDRLYSKVFLKIMIINEKISIFNFNFNLLYYQYNTNVYT